MKELLNIMRRRRSKWCMPLVGAVSVAVIIGSIWLNVAPFSSGFEITDELGGNIFPSSILCVATTGGLDVCRKPEIMHCSEGAFRKSI